MKLYINLLPGGYPPGNKTLELLHLCSPQDIRTLVMLRGGGEGENIWNAVL